MYEYKQYRKPLTELQSKVLELNKQGLPQKTIAKQLNRSQPTICECLKLIAKKGYEIRKQSQLRKPIPVVQDTPKQESKVYDVGIWE